MTPLEYGRLQGVGDTFDVTTVSENQALFAFGDAVCLPVVEWLLRSYVLPLTAGELEGGAALP
jgi:DNA (cytosine-5)-methyltransferase 1